MTQFAVPDLIGENLNMAVAMADGHAVRRSQLENAPGIHEQWPRGNWEWIRHPSTAWAHGGPIIEREGIELTPSADGTWYALWIDDRDSDTPATSSAEAQTPLVAAMCAYVASKFGETIDLP
jgi:hypothetical protein